MGATGLAYWWMKHRMEPVTEWAAINHPLQPWILKAHIIAAPVLVFAVGLIASDHILKHARKPKLPGRKSGHTALWFLIPMTISGYLIQTVTHQGWLRLLAWLHLGTGTVYLLGLAAHQWVFRSRKRKKEKSGGREAGPDHEAGPDPQAGPDHEAGPDPQLGPDPQAGPNSSSRAMRTSFRRFPSRKRFSSSSVSGFKGGTGTGR